MTALRIEYTKITPKIIFDPENDFFEISEKSIPHDAVAFYFPVLEWLNEYKKSPNDLSVFNFKLDYFNTASGKYILEIFRVLEQINETHRVIVKWYYEEDDEDAVESGEYFDDVVKIKFEFIEQEF